MAFIKHRYGKLLAAVASLTGGVAVLQGTASAQFGGTGFICSILSNLASSFPFLAPFLSFVLSIFGCDISPG